VKVDPTYTGSCTGVLLRNDWVITARHCVTTDRTANGPVDTDGAHFTLSMDRQVVKGAEIVDPGTQNDFAFIIATPFFQTGPNSNQASGWRRPVYSGSDSSLVEPRSRARIRLRLVHGRFWIVAYRESHRRQGEPNAIVVLPE
jgi:hypothetical protein